MSKNKNSAVVISHTTPRKPTTSKKVAPAGCRTIEPITTDIIEMNFVARVELLDNGCWLWHGSIDGKKNTGKMLPTFWAATSRANHKILLAYRYAYEKRIGQLPDQKTYVLRNQCGEMLCANPYHYQIVLRKSIVLNEATPVMRHNQKTALMCRKGLHERNAENTALMGKDKRPFCLPCSKAHRRARYLREKAEKISA
jgi:hypothetical protein